MDRIFPEIFYISLIYNKRYLKGRGNGLNQSPNIWTMKQ